MPENAVVLTSSTIYTYLPDEVYILQSSKYYSFSTPYQKKEVCLCNIPPFLY